MLWTQPRADRAFLMTIRLIGVPPSAALIDDVLLDGAPGVTAAAAAAAFAGIDLSGIRYVLSSGTGPVSLPLPPGCVLVGADVADVPSCTARRLDREGRAVAWMLRTRLDGTVVHAPGPELFTSAALDLMARAGPLTGTLALTQPVAAQLAAAGVALRGPRLHSRVLVIGGARSGKSAYAEGRFDSSYPVTYVATGPVSDDGDPEWAARIRAHRERRPASWSTHETVDVAALLRSEGTALLIDGLGTWLATAMEAAGFWQQRADSDGRLAATTNELIEAWRRSRRPVVAVTDEVGCGVVPASAAGRRFRDEMGKLNAALAATSDEVWFVLAGIPRRIR